MEIKLAAVLPLDNLQDYKVHFATANTEGVHPLDVFVRDREEWQGWQEWRGKIDLFNRRLIFSLIDFRPEPNVWLYGGTFHVVDRTGTPGRGYRVELVPQHQSFIGRLKIGYRRVGMQRSRNMENLFDKLTVSEILRAPYEGETFPGYEDIKHGFHVLENIFRISKVDWKSALEKVKGVYLIADRSNGKKYVGAAYGEFGIWARWSCYMGTGHGYNDELTRLIREKGIAYARENFVFSLLEYRPMKTDDRVIIARESYWKGVLLSRGFGYNKN